MTNETSDHTVTVNTAASIKSDGATRLPHERDEAADAQPTTPRENMKQAAKDLADGLVDTDLHGIRGVEKVVQADDKATPANGPKPA